MEESMQYLYEYKKEERVRNLGFAKINRKKDKCTVQVYGREMDEVKGIVFGKPDGTRYVASWEPELYEIEEQDQMEVEE